MPGSNDRPPSHREWQATNSTAYGDLWNAQRSALGSTNRSPFGDWFELNLEITNRYWAEFIKQRASGRRLLECGGATARLPVTLASEGWDCTMVDITQEGPLLARARFDRSHLSGAFVTGDVLALPFQDETFDVVYSSGLLDVLPDIRPAIREMTRVLRPGGLFVAASNPRRRSVQTVTEQILTSANRVRRLIRPRPNQPPRPAAARQAVFRNDFSLAVHLDACRGAGLERAHGHGVGLLPVVSLSPPLMRAYVRMMRLLEPVCMRFNRSEAAWTAKWGVMLALYGIKGRRAPEPPHLADAQRTE